MRFFWRSFRDYHPKLMNRDFQRLLLYVVPKLDFTDKPQNGQPSFKPAGANSPIERSSSSGLALG